MATNNSINTGKPIEVPHGGTTDASFTAYAPITGGTTSTSGLQSAATGLSTSGYVLTSNGSSALPSFQASSGSTGGLILLATKTASASASVAFTSLISGSYNNYVAIVSNYLPANDGTNLYVQFSTDNGSTYSNSCTYASIAVPYNTSLWTNDYNASGTGYLVIDTVHNSGVPACAYVILQNITAASVNQGVNSTAQANSTLTSGYGFQICSSQSNSAGTVFNALRFIASAGNITQGTFSLYALAQ